MKWRSSATYCYTPRYTESRSLRIGELNLSPIRQTQNGNWMNLNEICWIWNLEMARLLWLTQFFIYWNFIEIFIDFSLNFHWNFSSYLFELLCTLPFLHRHNYVCFLEDAERNKLLDSYWRFLFKLFKANVIKQKICVNSCVHNCHARDNRPKIEDIDH